MLRYHYIKFLFVWKICKHIHPNKHRYISFSDTEVNMGWLHVAKSRQHNIL